jgi:hypothetical protein
MARHRKIDVRMWGDEKFQRLSRSQPCGQALFQYLLLNPAVTSVPGLFRAGRPQLADELGWSLEGFDEAFAELFREGLAKADWKARVVWIPGARKYNAPENPNVVKSWRVHLDELPECALKTEAMRVLKELCKGLGKGFAEAFGKSCANGMANPEPEPEPEQEEEARARAAPAAVEIHEPRLDPEAVTAADVQTAWQAQIEADGGCPGMVHTLRDWREPFGTVAAALNQLESAQRRTALVAVVAWFWTAPDGPVCAGRVKRGRVNPSMLSKNIGADLANANQWWVTRDEAAE